jgi:hypothetical protein
MRPYLAAFFLCLALALVPTAAPALKFNAVFGSIKVSARPGDIVTRSWQLHLVDDHGARFHAKVEDWWQSEDGERSFYGELGTLRHSCGPWITLSPVETAVAAGGTLAVQLTAAVPLDAAPGGYWCVLTVDQLPDPLAPSARGVQVGFLSSISTGIFIYLDPVVRQVEIAGIDISARQAKITVRNVGNAPVGLVGRIEILRTAGGAPVVSAAFHRATVLTEPSVTRSLVAVLPDLAALPAGHYLARVVLDLGLDHDLGAQRELVIPNDLSHVANNH